MRRRVQRQKWHIRAPAVGDRASGFARAGVSSTSRVVIETSLPIISCEYSHFTSRRQPGFATEAQEQLHSLSRNRRSVWPWQPPDPLEMVLARMDTGPLAAGRSNSVTE